VPQGQRVSYCKDLLPDSQPFFIIQREHLSERFFGQQECQINISKRLYHLSVCVVSIKETNPNFGVTCYYVSVCGEYAIGPDSEPASTSIRQFNRNYRVFNGVMDIC